MSTSNETVKLMSVKSLQEMLLEVEAGEEQEEWLLQAFQRNTIEFAIQAVNKAGGDNRAIHMLAIRETYAAELKKIDS